MRIDLSVLALCACLAACGESYESMPTDQVCRDTGYAIASRLLDCEGDTDLADATYATFREDYECLVRDLAHDPVDVYYHCVAEISGASCGQVRRFGSNLSRYLTLSPACAQYLSGPGLQEDEPEEVPAADDDSTSEISDAGVDGGAL